MQTVITKLAIYSQFCFQKMIIKSKLIPLKLSLCFEQSCNRFVPRSWSTLVQKRKLIREMHTNFRYYIYRLLISLHTNRTHTQAKNDVPLFFLKNYAIINLKYKTDSEILLLSIKNNIYLDSLLRKYIHILYKSKMFSIHFFKRI